MIVRAYRITERDADILSFVWDGICGFVIDGYCYSKLVKALGKTTWTTTKHLLLHTLRRARKRGHFHYGQTLEETVRRKAQGVRSRKHKKLSRSENMDGTWGNWSGNAWTGNGQTTVHYDARKGGGGKGGWNNYGAGGKKQYKGGGGKGGYNNWSSPNSGANTPVNVFVGGEDPSIAKANKWEKKEKKFRKDLEAIVGQLKGKRKKKDDSSSDDDSDAESDSSNDNDFLKILKKNKGKKESKKLKAKEAKIKELQEYVDGEKKKKELEAAETDERRKRERSLEREERQREREETFQQSMMDQVRALQRLQVQASSYKLTGGKPLGGSGELRTPLKGEEGEVGTGTKRLRGIFDEAEDDENDPMLKKTPHVANGSHELLFAASVRKEPSGSGLDDAERAIGKRDEKEQTDAENFAVIWEACEPTSQKAMRKLKASTVANISTHLESLDRAGQLKVLGKLAARAGEKLTLIARKRRPEILEMIVELGKKTAVAGMEA
jgi:hypothetical protein